MAAAVVEGEQAAEEQKGKCLTLLRVIRESQKVALKQRESLQASWSIPAKGQAYSHRYSGMVIRRQTS